MAETRTKADEVDSPLAVIGILAMIPIVMVWMGYVASHLWLWFVVPVFGLPPLSIATAAGLGLVVQVLRPSHGPKDDGRTWGERITLAATWPGMMLLSGWFLKTYFM